MIEVGFVTDIAKLMRRRRRDRMAVRRAAWAELTSAAALMFDHVLPVTRSRINQADAAGP